MEIINLVGKKEHVLIESIFTDVKCVPYPNSVKDQSEDCVLKFQNYDENVVLLGLPGGGKSTLIKRLLYQAVQNINAKKIRFVTIF
jgi:DNA replication protein DnaC